MIPPRGFKAEQYPLQHKLVYSFGLSAFTATMNTALVPLVMGSNDMDVDAGTVNTNPHNPAYEEDNGPLCRQMSIIDKMRLSIKFNLTVQCQPAAEIASGVFGGDGIQHIKLLWRPFAFSFPEKLNAADDDTNTTVATLLGLTSDDTNQDVVPITTTKLPVAGASDLSLAPSTVNATQIIGDYNMSTDFTMEEHVWDENLFQNALRRFTNKGALRACVGRTRHVHLSQSNPFKSFFIDKFVPRSIRRVVDRTFFGIQVHLPTSDDIEQDYHSKNLTANLAHVGCKIIANYHEWNPEHDQGMGSQV